MVPHRALKKTNWDVEVIRVDNGPVIGPTSGGRPWCSSRIATTFDERGVKVTALSIVMPVYNESATIVRGRKSRARR